MVTALLDAKADAHVSMVGGLKPLHVACHHEHPEVCTRLLESRAVLDAPTTTGVTPVQMAFQAGNPDALCLLLREGERAVEEPGQHGSPTRYPET